MGFCLPFILDYQFGQTTNRLDFPVVQNCVVKRTEQIFGLSASSNLTYDSSFVWCAYLTRCEPSETEAIEVNRHSSFFVWSRLFEAYEKLYPNRYRDYCLPNESLQNNTFPIRIDPKSDLSVGEFSRVDRTTHWSDFNGNDICLLFVLLMFLMLKILL